jgi:predicted transcriptional regulator
MKQIITKQKINPSEFVSTVTGETLDSINPNITSLNSYNNDLVIMDYKEFVIIDSKALAYIMKNFSEAESGRVLKMANMVQGCFNILHVDKTTPHTDETLAKEIDYTRNMYYNFMKKLYMKGIIYYVTGTKYNKEVKYILLNPHLAKKKSTIHKECLTYFDDFRTLENKTKNV